MLDAVSILLAVLRSTSRNDGGYSTEHRRDRSFSVERARRLPRDRMSRSTTGVDTEKYNISFYSGYILRKFHKITVRLCTVRATRHYKHIGVIYSPKARQRCSGVTGWWGLREAQASSVSRRSTRRRRVMSPRSDLPRASTRAGVYPFGVGSPKPRRSNVSSVSGKPGDWVHSRPLQMRSIPGACYRGPRKNTVSVNNSPRPSWLTVSDERTPHRTRPDHARPMRRTDGDRRTTTTSAGPSRSRSPC